MNHGQPDRLQSKTLLAIDKRGSKIAGKSVFDVQEASMANSVNPYQTAPIQAAL